MAGAACALRVAGGEAGGDDGDRHGAGAPLVDHGAEDDVGVVVGRVGDDARGLVDLVEREIRAAGDVEQDAARALDGAVQQRRADGHGGRLVGAIVSARLAHAHDRRAGVLHDGAHVREVQVDETRDGDEVGDALDALAQHVVGVAEGIDDRGAALHGAEQAVVRDGDDRIGGLAQAVHAVSRLLAAFVTLEGEGQRDDGHGQGTDLAGDRGDDRRAAGAGAAAFSGGDEHQVRAPQGLLELVARVFCGAAADLCVGAAAQPMRELLADVDLDVGVADGQRLHVRVDGDELDPADARIDHAVDGIGAGAADADHLDGGHVGPGDVRLVAAPAARSPGRPAALVRTRSCGRAR